MDTTTYGAVTRLVRDAKTYYAKVNKDAGLPMIMGNDVELAEKWLSANKPSNNKVK